MKKVLLTALLLLLHVPAAAQSGTPVWTKPDMFWYRRAIAGGHVWMNVDAQHGVREPLFDHQRLAIELNLRMGTEYTPLTLPFADPALLFTVKYDGSNAYIQEGAMAIEFVRDGNLWRCDLQTKWNWNKVPPTDYECLNRRPAGTTSPALPLANVTSPDGKWEAFIENSNVVLRAVGTTSVRRLTTDGVPGFAWQAGSIAWSRDSGSLNAYRASAQIWESDALSGTVKPLLAYGEWKVAPAK